jgi:hypothetical protein
VRGFTLYLFDAPVAFASQDGSPAEQVAAVDLPGILYVLAALVYTAGASALTFRRYRGAV